MMLTPCCDQDAVDQESCNDLCFQKKLKPFKMKLRECVGSREQMVIRFSHETLDSIWLILYRKTTV